MTFSHTLPIDINGNEVMVTFEFTCSSIVPATWDDPAEGGEVEIESAAVVFPKREGQKEDQWHELPDWLFGLLATDEDVIEKLGESCDWGADNGPDPDDEYERKRDNP